MNLSYIFVEVLRVFLRRTPCTPVSTVECKGEGSFRASKTSRSHVQKSTEVTVKRRTRNILTTEETSSNICSDSVYQGVIFV